MDEELINQLKAKEAELQRQLDEEKAKNMRLELEMKFKDKTTGLWNRKYLEKIIMEKTVGDEDENFTVVCTEIDNLDKVNAKMGANMGDALYRQVAQGVEKIFGESAVCCKYVGTRMCVLLITEKSKIEDMVVEYENFIINVKSNNNEIDISYGIARKSEHVNINASGLIKEAEYALHMQKAKKEIDSEEVVVKKVKSENDGITILMIDDSMIILRTLQMMLKDDYKILMTTSGMEGYEIAKTKLPDIILLDYNMPVVDGERILHLLKKSNVTKNIPVIFISGVSDKEKIIKVATLKPAGYLLKPVTKDDLLETINTVLQS